MAGVEERMMQNKFLYARSFLAPLLGICYPFQLIIQIE